MPHSSTDHTSTPPGLWWFVFSAGALTLFSGTLGMWMLDHAGSAATKGTVDGEAVHSGSPWPLVMATSVYHSVQMLVLHTPHFHGGTNAFVEVGRWSGLVTAVSASVLVLWKRLRMEFLKFRASTWSGHYMVCGLSESTLQLVECLREENRDRTVLVLDPDPAPHLLGKCTSLGVPVVQRSWNDPKLFRGTRMEHCQRLIVACADDGANIDIVSVLKRFSGSTGWPLSRATIQLFDSNLRSTLQHWFEEPAQGGAPAAPRFVDIHDTLARRFLEDHPLDGNGIAADSKKSVHLVILGFGRMGRSLALRAAKSGHYSNGRKIRISVLDRTASSQRQRLLFRFPVLSTPQVCSMEFHQMEAESFDALRLISGLAGDADVRLQIAVCLDDDLRSLEVGMRLFEAVGDRLDGGVAIRLRSSAGVEGSLLGDRTEPAKPISPGLRRFGSLESVCRGEHPMADGNDEVARAVHDDFVSQRMGSTIRKPENDPALKPWEALPEDIRESNRQQADHIPIKLRAIGLKPVGPGEPGEPVIAFAPIEVETLARAEHERWNAERWLAGWRYGSPNDKLKRVSPYLVGWDDLDDSIREYDREAVRRIPAVLGRKRVPLKVVRA